MIKALSEGPAGRLGRSIGVFCLFLLLLFFPFCLFCCVILHSLFALSGLLSNLRNRTTAAMKQIRPGLGSLQCPASSKELLDEHTPPSFLVPSHFPKGTLWARSVLSDHRQTLVRTTAIVYLTLKTIDL